MHSFIRPAFAGLFLSVFSTFVNAQTTLAGFSEDEALSISQAAIGRTLEELSLTNTDGAEVKLSDYRGKPLVISLIFTSCHHICPTTTQHLNEVVEKARDALDTDSFHVITVGFDTANDNPGRMDQFGRSAGVSDPNWDFLAGDAASIETLTNQLGFIYTPTSRGFDHLIQASIIDAQGVVYRHVYGITFPTPLLIEPLKNLIFGTDSEESTLDYLEHRIRLFCTVYDPTTDSYRIDISVFIGTFIGIIVSILFGSMLFKEWRKSIKADK